MESPFWQVKLHDVLPGTKVRDTTSDQHIFLEYEGRDVGGVSLMPLIPNFDSCNIASGV
jgi:hypothetical protein